MSKTKNFKSISIDIETYFGLKKLAEKDERSIAFIIRKMYFDKIEGGKNE